MTRPRGVVVLGMHRSGTSAVCRLLNLLGADVGPSDDLLTDYDNPAGHWESRALVACNDRILGAYGRSWDFPPRLGPGWELEPRASALLPELATTFDSVFGDVDGARPWAWKDPRTCLTFPLWRRVLDEVTVLHVFRDPSAVAASVQRRDGIPRLYCTGLWLHYVRAQVVGSAGLPAVVLHFEDLVREPAATAARLARDLQRFGVALAGDPAAAADSVRDELVHEEPARGRWRHLTAPASAALASLPPACEAFRPPLWHQPRWIWPFLVAYRSTWVVRARTGHPLRTGWA